MKLVDSVKLSSFFDKKIFDNKHTKAFSKEKRHPTGEAHAALARRNLS